MCFWAPRFAHTLPAAPARHHAQQMHAWSLQQKHGPSLQGSSPVSRPVAGPARAPPNGPYPRDAVSTAGGWDIFYYIFWLLFNIIAVVLSKDIYVEHNFLPPLSQTQLCRAMLLYNHYALLSWIPTNSQDWDDNEWLRDSMMLDCGSCHLQSNIQREEPLNN